MVYGLRVLSTLVEKAWQQEREAAGLFAFRVRKQREMSVGAWVNFPPFFSVLAGGAHI